MQTTDRGRQTADSKTEKDGRRRKQQHCTGKGNRNERASLFTMGFSYGLKCGSRSAYQRAAIAGWFDEILILTVSPPGNISHCATDNATDQESEFNL